MDGASAIGVLEVLDAEGASLQLRGRLCLRGVPVLREALHARLDAATGPGDVVVDLSGVTACDTAGLAVLLSAHRAARAGGRRLVLTRLAPPVARALLRTRLHRVLDVGVRSPLR